MIRLEKQRGKKRGQEERNIAGLKLMIGLVGRPREGVGEIMPDGLRPRKDAQDIYELTRLAPSGGAGGWKYLKILGRVKHLSWNGSACFL